MAFRLASTRALTAVATPRFARAHHVARVRAPAPAFTAGAVQPNGSITNVSLSDYKGKYVVLFTYPLDFTFVCPTEVS